MLFVTTAFVANAVIRDDETGFGPIVRSTSITKFAYLIGRFLGAFAIAALCLMLVPLAITLGSLIPWADAATMGPNRLADHLYSVCAGAVSAEHQAWRRASRHPRPNRPVL